MSHTATYTPDDNKLRLYPLGRLDDETYKLVHDAGFRWAPKQELFVAPAWSPWRADLLLKLCGEIEDDDKSLVERAEERADRFEEYAESRRADSAEAFDAGRRLADSIPFGQPILVGHHSEGRARRDAERIASATAASCRLWETASYWDRRAVAALASAKYKQQPQVRARRIKKLEAELRGFERQVKSAEGALRAWRTDGLTREQALDVANKHHYHSFSFSLAEYPREAPASLYEGPISLWGALDGFIIEPEQARDLAVRGHEAAIRHADRWKVHLNFRLTYERAMLAEQGGLVTDRKKPEVGGACRCLWAPRGAWAVIQRVNPKSVTVHHTYQPGGRVFRQTVPFDKLGDVMSKAALDAARADGRVSDGEQGTCVYVVPESPECDPVHVADSELVGLAVAH
jgi:hypothetical protein